MIRLLQVLLIGLALGYAARMHTTADKAMMALIRRDQAKERFWETKTNQLINTNEPKSKGVEH